MLNNSQLPFVPPLFSLLYPRKGCRDIRTFSPRPPALPRPPPSTNGAITIMSNYFTGKKDLKKHNYTGKPFGVYEPKSPYGPPMGFADLEFPIKFGLAPPMNRRDHAPIDYSQNHKNLDFKYPVHNPNTPNYKLLCTLDKMKVGDYLELKGRDLYSYVYSQASLYASKLRTRYKQQKIVLRYRGAYDVATNTGRLWRVS